MERLSQPLSSAANKAFFGSLLGKVFYALFFTTQCLRIEKQLKSMFLLLICDNSEITSDHFFQSFSITFVLGRRWGHYFFLQKIDCWKGYLPLGDFFQAFSSWARVFENWKLRATVRHSALLDFRGVSRPSDPTLCTPVFIYIYKFILWWRTRMGEYVKCSSWERCIDQLQIQMNHPKNWKGQRAK